MRIPISIDAHFISYLETSSAEEPLFAAGTVPVDHELTVIDEAHVAVVARWRALEYGGECIVLCDTRVGVYYKYIAPAPRAGDILPAEDVRFGNSWSWPRFDEGSEQRRRLARMLRALKETDGRLPEHAFNADLNRRLSDYRHSLEDLAVIGDGLWRAVGEPYLRFVGACDYMRLFPSVNALKPDLLPFALAEADRAYEWHQRYFGAHSDHAVVADFSCLRPDLLSHRFLRERQANLIVEFAGAFADLIEKETPEKKARLTGSDQAMALCHAVVSAVRQLSRGTTPENIELLARELLAVDPASPLVPVFGARDLLPGIRDLVAADLGVSLTVRADDIPKAHYTVLGTQTGVAHGRKP